MYHGTRNSCALNGAPRPTARSVRSDRRRDVGAIRVAKIGVQHHVANVPGDFGVAHAAQRLDPPIEVALHQVGAADIQLRLAAVLEIIDARVLEETADDRRTWIVLADARNAGAQRADPAHDQSILTPACDARYSARTHRRIGDGVVLDDDRAPAGPPGRARSRARSAPRSRERRPTGATSSCVVVLPRRVSGQVLNTSATSSTTRGSAVNRPKSV